VLPTTIDIEAYRPRPHPAGETVRLGWSGSRTTAKHLHTIDAAFGNVRHAVIGAVAANLYMPQRHTSDIDFAVAVADEQTLADQLTASGWTRGSALTVNQPVTGWQWTTETGATVDVVSVPGEWGEQLVTAAASNRETGVPMATLPHLVALKLVAGRAHDASDIQRMLGHQDELTLASVRALAGKVVGAEDLADLDQLIAMGQLEYGAAPPDTYQADEIRRQRTRETSASEKRRRAHDDNAARNRQSADEAARKRGPRQS